MGILILCKMNKNLETRKAEMASHLSQEYTEKPRRWWQGKEAVYETTWDAGNENGNYRQTSERIIVRYHLKRALISSALFFIGFFLTVVWPAIKEGGPVLDGMMPFLIFTLFILYPVVKALYRRPKMMLDKNCLWIHKNDTSIPWNCIAASYIKKVENDDSASYYLLVHFFNSATDEFDKMEIYLDDLDIGRADLAVEIECRKLMSSKC